MKERTKGALRIALRLLPLAACMACMGIYLLAGPEISAEGLQNFAPEKPLYAAAFLLLLYAAKSLTVVFPIAVLHILGGYLFDAPVALLVNTAGVLVTLSIPYWIGRASGAGLADKLLRKYPKIEEFLGGSGSDFFLSFFLRVISCLPGDIVSMCFGARRMPFLSYLIGSFLGILPGMIATTLLGTSITNPTSPRFWISIGLTAGISVLSFSIYVLRRKHRKGVSE